MDIDIYIQDSPRGPDVVPAVQETRVRSLGQEDPPEEGMANPLQYSCLEIQQTEEPGGLQSMELQRVGPD